MQPAVLQLIARASGGRFYQGAASVDVKSAYADLGSRVGQQAQDGRGDRGRSRRRDRLHAVGRAALRPVVPEVPVRTLLVDDRRGARGRGGARARRRCDERVPRHPVVHPRAGALGGRAGARHRAVPALVPRRQEHRRRARRAGDLARRARRLHRPARRTGAAGRDDDALRALPRRLDVEADAALPAAARVRARRRAGAAARRSLRASRRRGSRSSSGRGSS